MFPTEAFILDKEPSTIVHVSDKETHDDKWGFVQFPTLNRLPDGKMLLAFQVAEDSSASYGKNGFRYFLSGNNGKQWYEMSKEESTRHQAFPGVKSSDESYISLETVIPPKVADLHLPEHPYTWIPYDYTYSEPAKAYRFEELPSSLQTLALRRTDKSGNTKIEHAPISLDRDLRIADNEDLPIIFFGPLKRLDNGELLGIFYPSYARENNDIIDTKSGTLLVHSHDGGKSWKQLDRLPYRPDLEYDPKAFMRGGFTEPAAEILDDGSLLLVLRTADGTPEPFPGFTECGPLYTVTRSADGHWSTPTPISPYGVMPQLLKMKNGLLVLSYGRPGVHVRISQDNGKTWSAPFEILKAERAHHRDETCGYSSLLEDPSNPDAFYIAYTQFRHKGADGKLHKAILVRRCIIKGPFAIPQPPSNETAEFDETVEQYYPGKDKILAVRIRLYQNKPHGLTEGFYQTSIPSFITPYKHGILHGLQKFFAPEGYLMKSIPYVEGKKHGVVRQYDRKGNILTEHYFLKGKTASPEEQQFPLENFQPQRYQREQRK